MLPLFLGRKVGTDGRLSVLMRTAAIPASVLRFGGWAMDEDGQPYVDVGPVASDRVFNQGIAFTPDGAMYVTDDAVTSTSIRTGGVAVSASGAVHYTVEREPLSGGIGLSSDGSISLGNEIASFSVNLQSSAIPEYSHGSGTPTFTRATTAYVLAYAADADVTTDDPILIQCASGEIRFTGARRISEGVWSSYDANGVFLSTTNGASALCCDASGPFGYLAEVARTNLCLQSQNIGTTWVPSRATVDLNVAVAPDGTMTADKIEETTDDNAHLIDQDLTLANVVYTFSAFVKAAERTACNLRISDGTTERDVFFDLEDGSVGTENGATGRIVAFSNDWYRCSITTSAATLATTGEVQVRTAIGNDASFPGTEGDGIYVWGMQLEAGAFPSSYIPTTTDAVLRNGDVNEYATSGNLNAAAMTIALDFIPQAASMGTICLFGSLNDGSNYTQILHDGTNIIAQKRIAGVANTATKAFAYVAGIVYRIVTRFDGTNGIDIWVDGVKGTGNAETAACQLGATFQIGASGVGTFQPNSVIRRFSVYPQGLSDAQCAAL